MNNQSTQKNNVPEESEDEEIALLVEGWALSDLAFADLRGYWPTNRLTSSQHFP